MKSVSSVVVIIIASLMIALGYMFLGRGESVESVEHSSSRQKIEHMPGDDDKSPRNMGIVDAAPNKVQPANNGAIPEGMTPEEWSVVLKYHEMNVKENKPISFYGKVVDQDGNAISSAKVTMIVTSHNESMIAQIMAGASKTEDLATKAETIDVYTDSIGGFFVSNKQGTTLTVKYIVKDGFFAPEYLPISYDYRKESLDEGRQSGSGDPIVFTLWKKRQKAASLIRGVIEFQVDMDGQQNGVNFVESKWLGEDIRNADIIISVKSDVPDLSTLPPRTPAPRTYNWEYSITAINGGILKTEESFLYEAPKEGYESEYNFAMKSDDKNWDNEQKDSKFYVKAHDGQVYASMKLRVFSYVSGEVFVRIQTLVNPTGSPNLQPDKSMTGNIDPWVLEQIRIREGRD